MLFNIDKISDKFDSMTDFIPLCIFDSSVPDIKQTMYVNKNIISGFTHIKTKEKECLLLRFNTNDKQIIPDNFTVCKEDNPVAFNELFKGLPEKLPKYDKTTGKLNTSS
jgi:hypothetical protein